MDTFKVEATPISPAVFLDSKKGHFEISGNSMPENVRAFYKPIMDWLDTYSESPNKETEFVFQMNLINTSSTKIFIEIFKKINLLSESSNVKITWFYIYGDEDIQDVGADFKSFTKVPFELVSVQA